MPTPHRSSRAEIDLMEIWGHIANDNPSAADRLLGQIDDACQMLAHHPRAGQSREDLAAGLRFYPVGNYLVFSRSAKTESPWPESSTARAITPANFDERARIPRRLPISVLPPRLQMRTFPAE